MAAQLGSQDDDEDGGEGPSLQFGVESGSSDGDFHGDDFGQGVSISRFQVTPSHRRVGRTRARLTTHFTIR
jgi:hypothetical protein